MGFSTVPCNEFVEVLGSKAPVPGGGGASALVGAVGTALGNMVGALTVGKKKYADVEEEMKELMAKATTLQDELLHLIERDAEVFEPLSKAYGMPRETEEEKAEKAREAGQNPVDALPEVGGVFEALKSNLPQYKIDNDTVGIGSTIFAVKPGDSSAREQAASCQKVLGGWANIAKGYATKRYRSNLINWGMLPFLIQPGDLPFKNLDYLFIPGIKKAVEDKAEEIKAYVVTTGEGMKEFTLKLGELTDEERQIILKGCLINYNRV